MNSDGADVRLTIGVSQALDDFDMTKTQMLAENDLGPYQSPLTDAQVVIVGDNEFAFLAFVGWSQPASIVTAMIDTQDFCRR